MLLHYAINIGAVTQDIEEKSMDFFTLIHKTCIIHAAIFSIFSYWFAIDESYLSQSWLAKTNVIRYEIAEISKCSSHLHIMTCQSHLYLQVYDFESYEFAH